MFVFDVGVVLSVCHGCFSQGPCHIELHTALDSITSSQQRLGEKFTTFYLPNCDKCGYYKAKQVGFLGSSEIKAPLCHSDI